MDSETSTPPARPDESAENEPPGSVTVVGIGASAGGLQALRTFFEHVPEAGGVAYVVIVHLDPDHASELAHLIQDRARIPVQWATDALVMEPDHVYVIPPGQELRLVGGALRLSRRSRRGAHAPIDLFFRTLADACGSAAAGVVLSGTGQDGASGLRRIKEAGGITAAQAPDEAEFDSMPLSAISTGLVDVVLPAAEIAVELQRLSRNEPLATAEDGAPTPPVATAAEAGEAPEHAAPGEDEGKMIRQILGRLRSQTGHDFSQYKLATVRRRIERRADFSRVETLADYRDLLRSEPSEVRALLKDLMISVSSFFRDHEAFQVLERSVVPRLFEGKGEGDRVRVWVPGCATGEEAYSIGILLNEHAAELDVAPEIQIFATDIDESALAVARDARYPLTIAADVPPERLRRYFIEENGVYRVVERVRDTVLVARHNLLRDAPFSRLDLISCRNVLIYFMPDAQARSLETFHYALRPSGHLFLGGSESAHASDELYTPIDRKHRIFQPAANGSLRGFPVARSGRDLPPAAPGAGEALAGGGVHGPPRSFSEAGALHLRMLEAYAPPSLIVNDAHEIVHLSPGAGSFLQIGGGAPSRDVIELARGELRIELRTALHQALRKGRPSRRPVRIGEEERGRSINLVVRPLHEEGDGGGGAEVVEAEFALVVFEEVVEPEKEVDLTGPSASRRRDDATFRDIEEELHRTRTDLREVIEEREGIVEEYQSAIEELQSINEEQSVASEELETSREELQSTNEELVMVNQEHRSLIAELNHVNADLRNLIDSTSIGTVFLDGELRVRRFTPAVAPLISLLESDVGRHLSDLSQRIQDHDIARDAERVLGSLERIEREVRSDDGRWYTLRIIPYRLAKDRIDGVVVTFFDITRQKDVEAEVRQMHRQVEAERVRLEEVLEHMQAAVLLAEASSGRILTVNRSFRQIFHEDFANEGVFDANTLVELATHPDGTAYTSEEWPFTRTARDGETVRDEAMTFRMRDGERVTLLMSTAPLNDANGDRQAVIITMIDISARIEMEEELRLAKDAAEAATAQQVSFMATVSHELRTPLNAILGYADLLLLTGSFESGQAQKLERIKLATRHLSEMIEEILAFERLEEGGVSIRPTAVDVHDMAEESAALVEPSAMAKGLAFHLDLPEEKVDLLTDRAMLRQVLLNLLANAVRFTGSGEVRLAVRTDEGRVFFDVRDTGIGIDPEHLDRVFDRFWQAGEAPSPVGGGVGIGLSVARRMSRLLGGDVELESEVDRGSTFTLWLPLTGLDDA